MRPVVCVGGKLARDRARAPQILLAVCWAACLVGWEVPGLPVEPGPAAVGGEAQKVARAHRQHRYGTRQHHRYFRRVWA